MKELDRIVVNPAAMTGRPRIRGMRIIVSAIFDLRVADATIEEILRMYPYLEMEDIRKYGN